MNNYQKLRKLKKNSKALSPVVASIILIAVTVAVSVVVAAWMSGSIFNLMGTTEQATITNLGLTDGTSNVIATVQNSGNAPVTITGAYVNGVTATNGGTPAVFTSVTILKGESASFTLTTATLGTTPLAQGDQVTVKMTTAKSNNLILSAFVP